MRQVLVIEHNNGRTPHRHLKPFFHPVPGSVRHADLERKTLSDRGLDLISCHKRSARTCRTGDPAARTFVAEQPYWDKAGCPKTMFCPTVFMDAACQPLQHRQRILGFPARPAMAGEGVSQRHGEWAASAGSRPTGFGLRYGALRQPTPGRSGGASGQGRASRSVFAPVVGFELVFTLVQLEPSRGMCRPACPSCTVPVCRPWW